MDRELSPALGKAVLEGRGGVRGSRGSMHGARGHLMGRGHPPPQGESGIGRPAGGSPEPALECWVCGVGGESPERNVDPQGRPGRLVPPGCQGRGSRKGSGHPEECGGFPHIVHVGTRSLWEADGLRLLGQQGRLGGAWPVSQQGLLGPEIRRERGSASQEDGVLSSPT